MNTRAKKIIYWVATIIMSAIFIFSAQMYLRNPEMIAGFFKSFNYPTYLVYPLAIAKILGVVAIITNRSKLLSEWAYAGFFFDAVLALYAHHVAEDDGYLYSLVALISLIISRTFWQHR